MDFTWDHDSVLLSGSGMDGDELGAVGEGRLDLDLLDDVGDAFHHLLAPQHVGAGLHQVGDRAAVARAFDDEVGDQRDRLGMVELHAALEAAAGDVGRHGDQQLVLFTRRQIHRSFPRLPIEYGPTIRGCIKHAKLAADGGRENR